MKHIEIRRSTQKKLGTLGVLSLAALSQFGLAPQAAQADPPEHAPAYGYRHHQNQQNDNYDNNNSDDRDSNYNSDDRDDNYRQAARSGTRNQRGQRLTVRGTVVTDDSGDVFTLRTDGGRTVRVYSRYSEPTQLSRGDYVEVIGYLDGNDGRFAADSVRVLRNTENNNNGNNASIRGTVTDSQRGPNAFTIRADNGRTYLVDTRNTNEPNLNRGDTVEVRGRVEGASIFATNVRVTSNNGSNGDNSNQVMTGRVSRDYAGREFELVTDNGRSVTVRSRNAEPIRLTSGDRVQVRGDMRNGIFRADSVRILRNDDTSSNGSRVNFTGTVQRGGSGQFTVRADTGRDYTVQNSNVSVGYGDRVRVIGTLSRGVVRAERVDVRGRVGTNNNNNGNGRNVRLEGRVRQVGNGYLVVRDSDDDKDYTVRANNASDFSRGDHVSVTGQLRGREISATSISRR